jgi:TRAP-type C4-dicarboxylate transport system permease small subunit
MSDILNEVEKPAEKHIRFSDLSFEEIISSIALITIVLSVTWGVITRYLLAQPAAWTGEVATILFAWVVFIGASAVFKKGEHISIDILLTCFSPKTHKTIQTIVDIGVLLVLATMTALTIEFAISAWDVPTTILRMPETSIYGGVAVGFILMTIRHGIFLVRRLRQGVSK